MKASSNFDLSKKLKPVYDAFDKRHYKQAYKLLNSNIQKYGPKPLFLVIKACILERMEIPEDSLMVLYELIEQSPTDETILKQVATLCKSLNTMQPLIQIYEKAVQKEPNSQDLYHGLYFAYWREFNFNKQYQTALSLFKHFKSDKYMVWAAICLEMQNPNSKTLQLASTMLQRSLSKSKHYQRVLVFINLLTKQKKYNEAIEVINNDLLKIYENLGESLKLLASLYFKNNQDDLALQTYQDILLKYCPDQWDCWMQFIDLMLKSSPSIISKTKSPQELALETIHYCQKNFSHLRGPYLAEIELFFRNDSLSKSESQDKYDHISSLIYLFYDKFGNKTVFYYDIIPYLQKLPLSDLQILVEKMDNDHPKNDDLIVILNIFQIKGHFNLFPHDYLFLGNIMYKYCLAIIQHQNISKEGPPTLGFLFLSVNYFCRYFYQTNDINALYESIALLEEGLFICPNSFIIKLWLLRLYLHPDIGACKRAYDLFLLLDIKNILYNTMIHFILSDLIRYGCFSHSLSLCQNIINFHNDYRKDVPDYITAAHIHENYQQIFEFTEFKDKLDHSIPLFYAQTELNFCRQVLQDKSKISFFDWFKFFPETKDELHDTNDYTVIKCYEPPTASPCLSYILNHPPPPTFYQSWLHNPDFSLDSLHLSHIYLKQKINNLLFYSISNDHIQLSQHLHQLTPLIKQYIPPNDDFLQLHWDFILNLFSLSLQYSQAISYCINVFHKNIDINIIKEYQVLWSTVSELINTLTKSLPNIMESLNLPSSSSITEESHFISKTSYLLYNCIDWVVTLLMGWIKTLPNRKSLTKQYKIEKEKMKNNEIDISSLSLSDDVLTIMLESINSVRSDLKSFFSLILSSLSQLQLTLSTYTSLLPDFKCTLLKPDTVSKMTLSSHFLTHITISHQYSMSELLKIVILLINDLKSLK